MKSRFISDQLDPLSDLSTGGNDASSVPSSFYPVAGHGGGGPSVSTPPVILPAPVPVIPAEAVAAQSVQNGTGGPGSVVAETSGGITFNLAFDAAAMASTTAAANFRAGIEQAASMLSATITDKITVNIAIDYSGTGGGAAAGPDNGLFVDYSTVRADLANNATKGDPTFNALPTGSAIQGQSQVAVWNAQLKLWSSSLSSTISGVPGANDTTTDDGSATFATDINSNLLVGVALHELTHALGRVPYGSQPDIFDFFRFTSPGSQLFANGNTAPAAYFSVDGGLTKIADYGQTSDPSDFLNSGVQGRTDPFNEFYNNSTFQSLTAADKEQLDALGFHLASPLTTTIQTDTNSIGSTSLVQFFGNYYLQNASTGAGPELKISGAGVVAGQYGAVWVPIGAAQTATGYDVAWKDTATNQYTVWSTDSSGNYIANIIGVVLGNNAALASIETTFQQDLNGDGIIGAPGNLPQTVIESFGATKLVEIGSNYFLESNSTGIGPELRVSGAPVVAGQYGAVWIPIGAEQTATGYDVAWNDTATNQFTVWSADSNGNYIANIIGVVSGNNTALQSIETTFQQDLNGDGVIGVPQTVTVIESFGSTKLVEVGNNYFLESNSSGTGPELKLSGTVVVADQFGAAWIPIGAEQTAAGYDVAWKDTATSQYTVWSTDSSGNYIANIIGVVSGSNTVLESLETTFQQDLNGDGVIGIPNNVPQTVIESFGSTKLVEIGSNYFLESNSTGIGPELQISGAPVVAGQYGAVWIPIGAEQTATGYDVAWKDTATNQFTVWSTDSNGNYIANIIPVVSGNNAALESIETTFQQDLNGDGVIGIPAAVASVATVQGTGPGNAAAQPHGAVPITQASDTFLFRAATGSIWNTAKEGNFELDALLSAGSGNQPMVALNDAQASQLHSILQSADVGHEASANHGGSIEANPILANLHGHFIVH
jgi:serralysin